MLCIPYKLRVGNRSVIMFVMIFVFTALFAGFYGFDEELESIPVLNGFIIEEIELWSFLFLLSFGTVFNKFAPKFKASWAV